MVGSHRLVEFIWGYLGEYLEISVMSAVRRAPRDDFGEFCQIVAILRWGDGKMALCRFWIYPFYLHCAGTGDRNAEG